MVLQQTSLSYTSTIQSFQILLRNKKVTLVFHQDKRRKALNRRRRRPMSGRTESDDSDLSEGALSASGGSDFSSSAGEGSSEGGLLALSDSDYLMDSQDQEEEKSPGRWLKHGSYFQFPCYDWSAFRRNRLPVEMPCHFYRTWLVPRKFLFST